MRIGVIDGLRGLLIIFMTTSHLNGTLHTLIGRIGPGAFGFVENAHGFVLMSGLVVGLVYGRRLIRSGAAAMTRVIHERCFLIWRWHVGLVLLFLASAFVAGSEVPSILAPYRADPVALPLASILLAAASPHMGILPMYIWLLLATPFVLRAFAAGRMGRVAVISAGLWLFGQSGAMTALSHLMSELAAPYGFETGFGTYFNVFGWQVDFLAGLAIGWLMASDHLSLTWLTGRRALIALGVTGSFFLLDRALNDGWLDASWQTAFAPFTERTNLPLIPLISTVADGIVIAWLLIRGPRAASAPIRALARRLTQLLSLPPLVLIGQNSLQLFAAHLPLVYAVDIMNERGLLPGWSFSLIILAAPLYLYGIARLNDWRKRPALQTAA